MSSLAELKKQAAQLSEAERAKTLSPSTGEEVWRIEGQFIVACATHG